MKKRILGLLVAMCLIISLLPISAMAVSGKKLRSHINSTQLDIEDGKATVYFTNLNEEGVQTTRLTQVTDGSIPTDNFVKLEHPAGGTPVVTVKNVKLSGQKGLYFGWKNAINAGTASALNAPYNLVLEGNNTITTTYQSGAAFNFNTSGLLTIMGTGSLTVNTVMSDNVSNTIDDNGIITCNGSVVIEDGVTLTVNYNDATVADYEANVITTFGASSSITVNGATININGVDGNGGMGSAFYTKGNLTIQKESVITINGKPTNNSNVFNVGGTVTINNSTVSANITESGETIGYVFSNTPVLGDGLTAVASTEVITDPAQATAYDAANATSLKYFKVGPKQEAPAEPAEFDGTSAELGDDLSLGFAIETAKVPYEAGMYAKLVRTGTRNDEKIISITDPGEKAYYEFWYDGIAAKEMNDEVSVTIYNSKNEAISETRTDSVKSYALRMLEDAKYADDTVEKNKLFKTLLVDMLNYGAMAQEVFDCDETNLVNVALSDAQKAYATPEMASCENTISVTGNGYLGTAFVLNYNIAMAMALDSSVIGKDCTAKVTFTDHDGNEKSATLTADETSTEATTVFVFNGLAAADGRCEVTWEFYNGETLQLTVKDSMESYVSRMVGEYAYLEALMNYSDAAYNYFDAD